MQFSGLIFKISELSTQFAVRYFGSNGEPVHFIPVCVFRNEYFVSVWTLKSLQAHKDTESSVFANFSYMKYWSEKKKCYIKILTFMSHGGQTQQLKPTFRNENILI